MTDLIEKRSLSQGAQPAGIVYGDGELGLFSDFEAIRQLNGPMRAEMLIIVLVERGTARMNLNNATIEVHEGDLFVYTPNAIVAQRELSADFDALCICLTTSYLQRVIPLAQNFWDTKYYFEQHPTCPLTEEERAVFRQYFALLSARMQAASRVQPHVVGALVAAFIFDTTGMLERVVTSKPRAFTAANLLFKRFVELIEQTRPRQRSVSYYAQQLGVTPKYLSAVCRKACGYKPTVVISHYVLRDVDFLLTHTQKSVKEVAAELGFTNLSFFGKYVKRHRGVSPTAFRTAALNHGR